MNINDSQFSNYNAKITDLENLFSIYEDEDGNYNFNLNETLYINGVDDVVQKYTLKYPMFWTQLSYSIYDTTSLAWLLMKLNKVGWKDLFQPKNPGDQIIYIPSEKLQPILEAIR